MEPMIEIKELDKLTLKIFSEIAEEMHKGEISLLALVYLAKLHEKIRKKEKNNNESKIN